MKTPDSPLGENLPLNLPAGSELLRIAYASSASSVTSGEEERETLVLFPPPIGQRAVLVKDAGACKLVVLTVPASASGEQAELELQTRVREWVEAGSQSANPKSQMMTMQGAQIIWGERHVAIFAQANRLATIRASLVETFFYDLELREIERTIGESWPQLEADMPLAFEFNEQSVGKRQQLRQRFQQVVLLRARLARIAPHVHLPHVHPPTLASQVEERFRERTRMVHRHEFLVEQIEVFEKVYDACGERASEYMLTRSSNTLEWIIILLLVTQIILFGFEILVNLVPESTPTTTTTDVVSALENETSS